MILTSIWSELAITSAQPRIIAARTESHPQFLPIRRIWEESNCKLCTSESKSPLDRLKGTPKFELGRSPRGMMIRVSFWKELDHSLPRAESLQQRLNPTWMHSNPLNLRSSISKQIVYKNNGMQTTYPIGWRATQRFGFAQSHCNLCTKTGMQITYQSVLLEATQKLWLRPISVRFDDGVSFWRWIDQTRPEFGCTEAHSASWRISTDGVGG